MNSKLEKDNPMPYIEHPEGGIVFVVVILILAIFATWDYYKKDKE
jgi:predicted negative regulator of RcsB-dependent stress response